MNSFTEEMNRNTSSLKIIYAFAIVVNVCMFSWSGLRLVIPLVTRTNQFVVDKASLLFGIDEMKNISYKQIIPCTF